MPVSMRGPNGENIVADEAKIAYWINQGFSPVTDEQIGAEIAARAAQPEDRGFVGDVNAVVAQALGGMTLGGSDMLLGGLMSRGQREQLAGDIENAPIAGTVARVAGEVLPAIVQPGSLLARSPAGMLGRASVRVGESIGGTGAVARTARLAATGATEGAVSNAGQYLGAMALQDKDASAEGFLASMRDGALYGGGAAGALGIAGEGLIAARRLIPETELTPVAVRRAREVAKQEVSAAVDESSELIDVGRKRTRVIVEDAVQRNPALRAELDQIALTKQRELAEAEIGAARAKKAKAEADAAAAQSRADIAATRAEKAKQPRKGKKAEEPVVETADTPEPPPVAAVADDLDTELGRQLQGTKSALDEGASLSDLSARRKEQIVEDAINARVAQESPEMERLLRHLNNVTDARARTAAWLDKHPRSKVKSFEYAEGMRKQTGWVDRVPDGEGSLLVPRGRQGEFRGTEAQRQSFERKVERKDLYYRLEDPHASAEVKAAAQARLDQMNAESAARRAGPPVADDARATAEEIVAAADEAVPQSLDRHIEDALTGHADLADDVEDATDAIGTLEQSSADLADELGVEAPPRSQERARQFRESQRASEESVSQSTEHALSDAERAAKTIELGETPRARKAGGLLDKANHIGQIVEAAQLLGIPFPDTSRIPVVGPLLQQYLRAKVLMRTVRGLGGKVARTAETEIAGRAAGTKDKLLRATDRALGLAGRAATSTTTARAAGATAAAVLSVQLFDDRDPATKERKTKKSDSLEEIYLARRDEIIRSQDPGAIRESVRKRIRTTDSALLDAIAATEERRLKFIYEKMPKIDEGTQILGKRAAKAPARSEIEQWAKYVRAANDPVATIEAMLDGTITSSEAAETIRVVYPRLLQDVQARIIEKAAETDVDLPYRQRIQLSTMLGIPLDDSQGPDMARFLDELYQAKQPAQAPMQPPAPTVIADSRAAERTNPETRV